MLISYVIRVRFCGFQRFRVSNRLGDFNPIRVFVSVMSFLLFDSLLCRFLMFLFF